MNASPSAWSYSFALNRNELFESPGLRRDIPNLLHPEEEVLLVLPGVAGDFPDVMIATASRFLLAKVAGPIKKARLKREVPAAWIVGVSYRPGFLTRVHVATANGRAFKMVPNRKLDAARFAEEMNHLVQTGKLPE